MIKLFDNIRLIKENKELKKEIDVLKKRIKADQQHYADNERFYEKTIRELREANGCLIYGTMERITFDDDKAEYIKKIPAGYMVEVIEGEKHWKTL